jgi:serine/threonine protein kinase
MFAGQTGTLDFAQLTPAADIYSLAKSVYTLFTGESPRAFANETITALPESIRTCEWADEFLRVVQKATLRDPRQRHQSVEEFWGDLAVLSEIVADGESETIIRPHSLPQAQVARGYTPDAPERPQFETDPDLPMKLTSVIRYPASGAVPRPIAAGPNASVGSTPSVAKYDPTRKRRRFRRLAVFAIFIVMFTGILYGTASYMRGKGVLPEIRNPFRTQTATANTDIYLRPSPGTDNDPIGLVTKNSKVRIVNTQNNWYQVDVIEQGKTRNAGVTATRGWLNAKYLDLD